METKFSASISISNEDDSYETFIKMLVQSKLLKEDISHFACKRAPSVTIGNKIKKANLDFRPSAGQYELQYDGDLYKIVMIQKNDPIIITQCKILSYERRIQIYGSTIKKVKYFVDYIFSLLQNPDGQQMMTIYENNGGYWRTSREKKPRKIQSVILKQFLIDQVLGDIKDFTESQQWYTEMGIPYKRSYLLYGPPGTGKSSFAQAIAAQIKYSICFVNCSDKINDFNFNSLLNQAPKKSVILIEDVDSIFSERKNTQKNNSLTFSGFLNAIDGVRSQQGRIIIMTTNYKERLDPALLRPGRVDQMYEITYASQFQIQKLCFRFFKNEELAANFANQIPENKFSMSQLQGFFLKYRKNPEKVLEKVEQLLNSDENVKIGDFLNEINCIQCISQFKLQECYTLASAKNLPKETLERIASKLNPLLKTRLIQVIRLERKNYVKDMQSINKFIQQSISNEQVQRKVKDYTISNKVCTLYVVRDLVNKFTEELKKQDEQN